MAQPSILDTLGQSILKSAETLDAHMDADSLVEQLAGEPATSRRTMRVLGELKDLAKREPVAVLASRGAVPALMRVVEQLTPGGRNGQDLDDVEWQEPLQDTLEALSCLIGDPKALQKQGKSAAADLRAETAAQRAKDVTELVVRHAENGKQLLRVLSAPDVSVKYDAMVLIQRVYLQMPEPIDAALLADPLAFGQLMQTLSGPEHVRNESMGLLLLLTSSNADIQTSVTFQGLVETIFGMLEEEDLTRGGKICRDLLQCFMNLISNVTCQKYVRESSGFALLVSAMSTALTGRRAGAEPDEDDEFDQVDVPEDVRWACFGLLVDAALAIAGAGGGGDGETSPEAAANQGRLIRDGGLGLCQYLLDARVALQAKLRIAELLQALEPCTLAATAFQSYDHGAPPLFIVAESLLGASTPLALRCALGRVLGRTLARHAKLQDFICGSLTPQLEVEVPPGGVQPAGRQVATILEDAAGGHLEPERFWFALQLTLAMLTGNADVQSFCTALPVAVPSDAGPAETFLELMLRVFSAVARACISGLGSGREDDSLGSPEADGTTLDFEHPAVALVGSLKLLTYWLTSCPAALVPFATSPVTVPLVVDLTSLGAGCGPYYQSQIEGLASLLLGICIKAEHDDVDAASLMALVAGRVGIENFQQKVDRLWRSEPLQKPARGLADARLYSGRFRAFVKEQKMSVQRRMVQLYVVGGVGNDGKGALSEDVADHYKQIIRVQDSELREVRKENEHLRREVENFMVRSLQASSAALSDKAEALQSENQALHTEVAQLQDELEEQSRTLEHERRASRAHIAELERELHSVAVGYEQVEQASAAAAKETAAVRAQLTAAERFIGGVGASPDDAPRRCLELERETATLRRREEEMKAERADLLELLGTIAASCPEARAFVAPLGESLAPHFITASTASGQPPIAEVAAPVM